MLFPTCLLEELLQLDVHFLFIWSQNMHKWLSEVGNYYERLGSYLGIDSYPKSIFFYSFNLCIVSVCVMWNNLTKVSKL